MTNKIQENEGHSSIIGVDSHNLIISKFKFEYIYKRLYSPTHLDAKIKGIRTKVGIGYQLGKRLVIEIAFYILRLPRCIMNRSQHQLILKD